MSERLALMGRKWFLLGAGIIVGALAILAVRFFMYQPPAEVHYHANFAVYLNGQQEQFKNSQYYEEVQMCQLKGSKMPTARAHMHDNVNNVVHVEDSAVTWGQFFENLGWYLGPTFIQSRDGTMYSENGSNKLHILLNGQDYTDFGGITNTVIKDQDKLLVSFGDEDNATLQQEYKAIPSTAQHYDNTKDPSTCSGSDSDTSWHARLSHLFK